MISIVAVQTNCLQENLIAGLRTKIFALPVQGNLHPVGLRSNSSAALLVDSLRAHLGICASVPEEKGKMNRAGVRRLFLAD
jgi:hypothetical protein